ncbi:DUF4129 domain-containing protein [Bacillus sp. KH172YL63]|uniref:DUF4129 domain-containing protein n=1 Tax=Bacillus sp. KH172YL63 TaxID=2709784 RepID=UPI0013E505FA|nr:DUF4129 domain-containing protein [Bacillus sp. KH172YL63]BCB03144.1 hypothetical protein KH172YL63_12770 [Bacillus sp. KH172YL63]
MESNIAHSFLTKHHQLFIVKLGLFLGLDILFVLLAATFFSRRAEFESGYVPLFGLVYLCLFLCMILSVKWGKLNSILLYGMLLAMLALGVYAFAVSWLVLLIALLFIHWRLLSHFQSEEVQIDLNSGVVFAFIAASVASLVTGSIRDTGNGIVIYCLLFLFIALIGAGTAVQRMMNRQKAATGGRYLRKTALIVLGVGVLGWGLIYASPFIRTVFYWFVEKLFWALSFLVDPIFQMLVSLRDWFMSIISGDTLEGFGGKLKQPDVENVQQNAFYETVSIPWLKEILLGLFLLAVILYVLKKRKVELESVGEEPLAPIISPIHSRGGVRDRVSSPIVYSDATNAIRTAMKKLEREADDVSMGRQPNETIRAWFSRLGLPEEEALLSLYETVRYGNKEPDQDEADYFISKIAEISNGLNAKKES